MTDTEIRSGIRPEVLQEHLDSATNAADKGQAQFPTPIDLARLLTEPLAKVRENICDLQSGAGHFILGASNDTTKGLLGVDIDPCRTVRNNAGASINKIQGDATLLYPMFKEVKWKCDFFTLNPPWDLHWHRDRLALLAKSQCDAVRYAFKELDPRLSKHSIDSTVATMMMALDLMTDRGEGVLVANASTIDRLIMHPNGPHRALAMHIWHRIVIAGNPCTGDEGCKWKADGEFKTAVIYFSRMHSRGCARTAHLDNLEELKAEVARDNRKNRSGAQVTSPLHINGDTRELFKAVRDEWANRRKPARTDYNIWLTPDGTIATNLSVFERSAVTIDKREAERLHALNGQVPMQLVLQSATRADLLHAVKSGIWRVHPEVPLLVEQAVRDYHAVRAPLVPLSPMQRLGYLDENDTIKCLKDFTSGKRVVFKAGEYYPLRTQTIGVTRRKFKPSLTHEDEEHLLNGHQLAIYIRDKSAREWCCLDKKLANDEITLSDDAKVDMPLEAIVEHFEIPHVPEIAEVNKDEYAKKREMLDIIEAIVNRWTGFAYKPFQKHDYAAFSLTNGAILAHEQGLGKSLAGLTIPLLWAGLDLNRITEGIYPAKPVLYVAPSNLHDQLLEKWKTLFNIHHVTRLDSQETYLRLTQGGLRPLKPGWYLTSFTQLTSNKVEKMPAPEKVKDSSNLAAVAKMMRIYGLTVDQAITEHHNLQVKPPLAEVALRMCMERWTEWSNAIGAVSEKSRIRCIYQPSLADYCGKAFEVVTVDEANLMKGEETMVGTGVRWLDPPFRAVMTGTPVKNRLPDIFNLCLWACHAEKGANSRFPYAEGQMQEFAEQFLVTARNLSQERRENKGQLKKGRGGKQPRGKVTAEVCNIHRIWKLLGPSVLRRRMKDVQEDLVKMNRNRVFVPMGRQQAEVYNYHLNTNYVDCNGKPAVGAKLQALRNAASAPHTDLLRSHGTAMDERTGNQLKLHRSLESYTPKLAVAMTIIEERIRLGEQAVVFSAFHEPLETIGRRLDQAHVPYYLCHGDVNPEERGRMSLEFSRGRRHAHPVMLCGLGAMAMGNDWPLAKNVIMFSYDWAWNLFDQAIKRVLRLNTPEDVNLWALICKGTIDRKLESLTDEKGDSAELVIDGELMGDDPEEVNLAELLKIAYAEFDPKATVDESELVKDWPGLRTRLQSAYISSELSLKKKAA